MDNLTRKLPTVAVLTVTRNRRRLLLRMLSQLRQLDYPREKLGVFLVDGASTDGTMESVRREFNDVHFVSTNAQMQLAACINIGIKEILKVRHGYKYIWTLDDDAEIESRTLLPLVEACENDPGIGIVGSVVYHPERRDELVAAGHRVIWRRTGLIYNLPEPESIENLFDVEIVPACSSMARTELYLSDKVGMWDERFWLYWPDNDWCLRALRNGYRVCSHRKSRVWHRSWTKPEGFYTPMILNSGVRGALLFYYRHSPLNSLTGIRKYMLKCHLKAAFERFTLRPNFTRAFEEGVREFVKGDTSMKDFSSWIDTSALATLEQLCTDLREKLPQNPKIILNCIKDESRKDNIKGEFSKHFQPIRWKEIAPDPKAEKLDPRKPLKDYILHYLPRLLRYLVLPDRRADLIISPVSEPYLYNVAAARYTMLVDDSLHGYVAENKTSKAFFGFLATILRGLRATFIDLPRAVRSCPEFRRAAEPISKVPLPSPKGLDMRRAKVI